MELILQENQTMHGVALKNENIFQGGAFCARCLNKKNMQQ